MEQDRDEERRAEGQSKIRDRARQRWRKKELSWAERYVTRNDKLLNREIDKK